MQNKLFRIFVSLTFLKKVIIELHFEKFKHTHYTCSSVYNWLVKRVYNTALSTNSVDHFNLFAHQTGAPLKWSARTAPPSKSEYLPFTLKAKTNHRRQSAIRIQLFIQTDFVSGSIRITSLPIALLSLLLNSFLFFSSCK